MEFSSRITTQRLSSFILVLAASFIIAFIAHEWDPFCLDEPKTDNYTISTLGDFLV